MKKEDTYKILLLTAEFPPQIGGIATVTSQVARELHGKQQGGKEVRVRVVTSVGRKEGEGFEFAVIRTPDFLNIKYLKILPLLVVTVLECLREKPDKILLGKWTHEAFVGFLVSKLFKIPYLTFVHGSEILKFSETRFLSSLLKGLLGAGEKVVAVSNFTKGLVLELGTEPEKVLVVRNGLKIDDYDTGTSGDEFVKNHGLKDKTVVLTVSRLVKRKGHDRVLEVLPELVEDHPDVVYLIAGDGDYREILEEKVGKLELGNYVEFLGFVEREDLAELYGVSDIFVMPNRIAKDSSDVEGFGVSFLEANLFGLPVIGGRSGGAVDAIVHGETGFLVDPGEAEEIKRRLLQLVEDPELRKRMGEQGRERVLTELNSENQVDRLAEVLFNGE